MNDYKYNYQFPKIETRLDSENNLKIIQESSDRLTKMVTQVVIDTREQQIREKLIELGWTPPAK